MTCIAGVVDNGRVYIGGDSAGVAGLDLCVRADSKVFVRGHLAFGFTSSFRMGQIIRYSTSIPELPAPDGRDIHEWMCVDFIDSIRAAFKVGGFASKESEREVGGHFLVGVRGRLFHVSGDYQVGENVAKIDACGCGESFALGAMSATPHLSGRDRVLNALGIAQSWSGGVRAPFHVVEVPC